MTTERPRLRDFGEQIFTLAVMLTRAEAEELSKLSEGLTPRQLRFLRMVDEGHSSPTALYEDATTTVSFAAISQSLDVMVQRGMLAREKDPEDGRRVVMTVTEHGRALLEAGEARLQDLNERLLAQMTDAELEVVSEVVTELRKRTIGLFARSPA